MITIEYKINTKEDVQDLLYQLIDTFKLTKPELMAIYEEVEEDGKNTGDN